MLDSESCDTTAAQARHAGFTVVSVECATFNHGGTRRWGVEQLPATTEWLICMTQDALLAEPAALTNLLAAFDDPQVAAVYGRQLPSTEASPIAAHSRTFNYGDTSFKVTLQDQERLGIKTCFLSNSFAAYRMRDLMAVGNFPERVILGEDACVAGKLLLAGKSIAYQADACVRHSHNYSLREDFQRCFDTGVFHAREAWLLQAFGSASGEGLRFVRSEMGYLAQHAPRYMPEALVRTLLKWLGYRLGRLERFIPLAIKRRMSMFRGFWLGGGPSSPLQRSL